jgi:hypothetical protein
MMSNTEPVNLDFEVYSKGTGLTKPMPDQLIISH